MEDTTKNPRDEYRTPSRILIPVLVESRENWKTKALERNRELKSAQVRIRDLANSRASWRQRAQDAEARLLALQTQFAQTQLLLDQAREEVARLDHPDQKNYAKPS